MTERACGEFVMVNGVKLVCGQPESAHTREAARADVGLDHEFRIMSSAWTPSINPK